MASLRDLYDIDMIFERFSTLKSSDITEKSRMEEFDNNHLPEMTDYDLKVMLETVENDNNSEMIVKNIAVAVYGAIIAVILALIGLTGSIEGWIITFCTIITVLVPSGLLFYTIYQNKKYYKHKMALTILIALREKKISPSMNTENHNHNE